MARTPTRSEVERAWTMRQYQLDEEAGKEPDPLEYSREFRNFWKAETNAALAAIERVRDLANSLRDRYADNSDAAYFTKQFLAALDGAPEPECEYAAGYIALDGKPHPFENRGYLRFAAEADREKYGSDEAILVRRRKAGPWEPVGGEG